MIGVVAALTIAAVLAILAVWRVPPFVGADANTENAYVRGRTTIIAPQVSGYVVQVAVRDYQMVPAGSVLARIDERIYRARVAQAHASVRNAEAQLANASQARAARSAELQSQLANVANAQAQLRRALLDMRRASDLVGDGSISARERDQTGAALAQAEAGLRQARAAAAVARENVLTVDVGREGLAAQVEGAKAALRLAEIDLSNTVIRAPEGGQLGEVGVRVGQYVTNGTQLMALVPPDRWVIANYKERQTRGMAPGQRATVSVDALGATLRGRVERISPATGSEFAVLKPDNATGNFIKVPQRIGVRIQIDAGQPLARHLRPGMSVEAHVDRAPPP
ncbi:HlyD family secretion protein [Sphingomonas sp. BK580]|uniref:HlyD family secretion protein n=1 Tax=Sphingomonas sp. BK580 TaxID=2586972 RepID=UPI00181E861E|nr:HlyD family secretion protein [Sphingomonas sp. BK580]MBB3695159.1 multidrug resistance efflux pump [Sphingomonas sp. BK580]